MSQTIRIIQTCNHMKRLESVEFKTKKLYRQETRNTVVNNFDSSKFMFYGNWDTVTVENGQSYKINTNTRDRCSVFFYGDDLTLYGIKHAQGGMIKIFLDGELVSEVDNTGTTGEEYVMISAADLDYAPHIVEIGVGDFDPAEPYYPPPKQISAKASIVQFFPISKIVFSEFLIDYKNDYDVISEDEIISEIESVFQTDESGNHTVFASDADYRLMPTNKVQWLGINRPKSGVPYYVKYKRKVVKFETVHPSSCEKCGGSGWYGSLQELNSLTPKSSTGINKIAEDIIKIILTPYDEDTGYGSKFKTMIQDLYTDIDSIEAFAISEIDRIEQWYKNTQNEEISYGCKYDPEDLLRQLHISDINFDTINYGLNMQILVINENDEMKTEDLDL